MRFFNSKTFAKGVLSAFLTIFASYAQAVSPDYAVEQLVQGTRIKNVSIAAAPHTNAVKLSIDTTSGPRHLILPKKQVNAALIALKNPRITGTTNAIIAAHIIQRKSALAQFVAPKKAVPISIKSKQPVINPLPTPSAAAIATMSATSANQQASR